MIKDTWCFGFSTCFFDEMMDSICVSTIIKIYWCEHCSTLSTEPPLRLLIRLWRVKNILVFCSYVHREASQFLQSFFTTSISLSICEFVLELLHISFIKGWWIIETSLFLHLLLFITWWSWSRPITTIASGSIGSRFWYQRPERHDPRDVIFLKFVFTSLWIIVFIGLMSSIRWIILWAYRLVPWF